MEMMRDGLQWVRQIPPWCAEPWHGPHRRCPLRIALWVGFFPLCTHASFHPSVLHECTRHICQSQYLEYGGVFIIWLTSNRHGDVTPFSFAMALAAAVSGTTRVLCSYNYVIKNGAIVSCDCAFYFWQYACTYIIDLNLKSQILTSIQGVTEAPPTWIPGFLLNEARPTFIRPRVPVAAEIACLETRWNFQ